MRPAAKLSAEFGFFTSKQEVLADILHDDLWPVTVSQGRFEAAPFHYHAESVQIYVLSGTLLVYDLPPAPIIRATSGTKITFPAGAVHSLSAEGEVVTITALKNAQACAGLPKYLVDDKGELLAERIHGTIA